MLPRSLHLPLASTEGSLARNLNKTAVRLWSDCPLIGSRTAPGRRERKIEKDPLRPSRTGL